MAMRQVSRAVAQGPLLWLFLIAVAGIIFLSPHAVAVRPPAWLQNYSLPQDDAASQSDAAATVAAGTSHSDTSSAKTKSFRSYAASKAHPIQALHQEALSAYERLVLRQSKTLAEAVTEYKRRYKRAPPPGFDKWYAYAVEQDSQIIDDFDLIEETIRPFWDYDPATIKQVRERASDGPELWTFSIHNGKVVNNLRNWMGRRIGESLGDAVKHIPDIDLLVNPLDEPRVLISRIAHMDHPHWTDGNQRASFDSVVGPCKYRSKKGKAAAAAAASDIETHGLPFITDRAAAMDVCQNPAFAFTHGFMIAPCSFFYTGSPVPILSQAAPSTFSDIIYPSMWYWDHIQTDLAEVDQEWDQKINKLYWSGSTTGGWNRVRHNAEQKWESHRHRFIELTKQLVPGAVYKFLMPSAKGASKGGWTTYESNEIMEQLYDTKFTQTVQCDPEACEAAHEYYKVQPKEDGRLAYKNRFVMDMDGNSFSGRFYNFLASQSCPLKQTIFREWHDERLVPWVHYVPISTSLEELPETMRFLALTEEGDAIARAIADEGREWHAKVLRKEDAAIYLYRLFLEYARVTSPAREATEK